MQFIQKQEKPPQGFLDAISNWNEANEKFEPAERYQAGQGGVELKYKSFVRTFLRNEQFGLCAICQRPIGSNTFREQAIIHEEVIDIEPSDIEHVVAQNAIGGKARSLEYHNLVASCRTPHTCNAARKKDDIKPYYFDTASQTTLQSINAYFSVNLGTYEIVPNDQITLEEQETVLKKFIMPYNLNQADLVATRKALFSDPKESYLKDLKANPTKLRRKLQSLASDQTLPFREFQLLFLHKFATTFNIPI